MRTTFKDLRLAVMVAAFGFLADVLLRLFPLLDKILAITALFFTFDLCPNAIMYCTNLAL